jgi:hypothetical protein
LGAKFIRHSNGVTPELFEIFQEIEEFQPYFSAISEAERCMNDIQNTLNQKTTLAASEILEMVQRLNSVGSAFETGIIPKTGEYTAEVGRLADSMDLLKATILQKK